MATRHQQTHKRSRDVKRSKGFIPRLSGKKMDNNIYRRSFRSHNFAIIVCKFFVPQKCVSPGLLDTG